jgi:hypothetical protein
MAMERFNRRQQSGGRTGVATKPRRAIQLDLVDLHAAAGRPAEGLGAIEIWHEAARRAQADDS